MTMSSLDSLSVADVQNLVTSALGMKELFFAFLGGLITWFYKTRKMKIEIKKIHSEEVLNSIKIAEKIFERRDVLNRNSETLGFLIRNCITDITNQDELKASESRDEIMNYFYCTYLPSVMKYVELKDVVLKADRKECLITIKYELFPFLKNCNNFLRVTNNEYLLSKLNVTPNVISKSSIITVLLFVKKYTPFYYISYHHKLKKLNKNLK